MTSSMARAIYRMLEMHSQLEMVETCVFLTRVIKTMDLKLSSFAHGLPQKTSLVRGNFSTELTARAFTSNTSL